MNRATRILAGACTAVVVPVFLATPVFGHSDQGTMTAEARPAAQPLTVVARTRVVFVNDGHPAGEATVIVSGTGPGGAQVGPTTLGRVDEGEYEAPIAFPAAGDWSLQFSSTNPAATATTTTTVQAPETTTPPPTERAGRTRRANRSGGDDSSGLNASVFGIVGGAVAVAAVVGGVLVVRRRR